ncbi:hypothetical protein GPECTOR_26g505 [Gonium pectorale]|uniref:Uncharacterized protein n=1 Tax=Gonium pectorale TaxID=33097 RepID=A0A150GFH6_GONPE|nr:hypothetical protein GPECTOR_26g505 [Gonium pectorale]|eukprot:KXZ48602.1 hypothetical protein GPECTOR_26g505 [Gonium pectorale]
MTLAASAPLAASVRVVFTGNPSGPSLNGLQNWLGPDVSGYADWQPLTATGGSADAGGGGGLQLSAAWQSPADVVMCVSAELAPKVCSAVLGAVRPRLSLIVVHRADTHTATARFLSLYPPAPLRLMALAPHVANLSSHKLRRPVDWSMPVAPFTPPGPACSRKDCLQGFSIQVGGERHVFLRRPDEDEVSAMARIMQMPEAEVFARRTALCELQREMNAQADGLLAAYLRQAATSAQAEG